METEQTTQRRFRYLRIAFSVACALAGLLLIVLWGRSYLNREMLADPFFDKRDLAIYSTHGVILAVRSPFYNYDPRNIRGFNLEFPDKFQYSPYKLATTQPRWQHLGFNVAAWSRLQWIIQAPYWFLTTTAVCCLSLPWIRWSTRFSLRTLLIVTSVFGAIFGTVIAMSR